MKTMDAIETAPQIPYNVEHIFSYTGIVGNAPEVIGPVPEGIKVNFYNAGGEITGPRLRGRLGSAGGDWATVRRDGVALLDVRVTFETHDGALILVTYQGMADFGPKGYETFLRGELPPAVQLRISPRFYTSHRDYLWLNRLFCFGVGEYNAAAHTASYDIYAVH